MSFLYFFLRPLFPCRKSAPSTFLLCPRCSCILPCRIFGFFFLFHPLNNKCCPSLISLNSSWILGPLFSLFVFLSLSLFGFTNLLLIDADFSFTATSEVLTRCLFSYTILWLNLSSIPKLLTNQLLYKMWLFSYFGIVSCLHHARQNCPIIGP